MQIYSDTSPSKHSPVCVVEHGGNKLEFSISCFRKEKFAKEYEIFEHLNRYWSQMNLSDQQAIFDIYNQIFECFHGFDTQDVVRAKISAYVNQLYTYHELKRVHDWIWYTCYDVVIPSSFSEVFVEDIERNFTEGKTYLKHEYQELIAFSLILRAFIPIFGEFIFSIRKNVNPLHKELITIQLIDGCFTEDMGPVEKLYNYIENNISPEAAKKSVTIYHGIPSADFKRYIYGLTVIKCLTTGDIRGSKDAAHLVTYISMYISSKVSPKHTASGGVIKEKKIEEDESPDGQKNSSSLERYKVKASISDGTIIEAEYFVSNHYKIAQLFDPSITAEDLDKVLHQVSKYENTPTQPQITLLKWLYSRVVSKNIIDYLPEPLIKQMLGVAHLVLWNHGHKYLSILLVCDPIVYQDQMVVSNTDSVMRIPEQYEKQINDLYPYTRNIENRKNKNKPASLVMDSISRLSKQLMEYSWRPLVDSSKINFVLGYKTSRYPILPEIKTELVKLVISLQTTLLVKG